MQSQAMTPSLSPSLVNVPNGTVGGESRQIGIAATGSEMQQVFPIHIDGAEAQGNAGFGESGLRNQFIFSDFDSLNQATSSVGTGIHLDIQTDQTPVDSESALTTNGHAVQRQLNASVDSREKWTASDIIFDAGNVDESNVSVDRALIDQSAVGVPNSQIGGETSSPSGDGTSSNLDVLNLKQFPLLPLEVELSLSVQLTSDKRGQILPIFGITPGLSQNEDQDNQNTLQHSLSFGNQTVPPDRNVVNPSVGNGLSGLFGLSSLSSPEASNPSLFTRHSSLSFDQLTLLNQATITIADLADGYLALTSGTTITLDTDAAGYGWFVDPTPFTSEEFLLSAISYQPTQMVPLQARSTS
ncbi:MAG: hypothetical protein RI101_08095 [Nitrospira sp.]|nr:hypothetical protein [Nitrospira sp.]